MTTRNYVQPSEGFLPVDGNLAFFKG